MVGKTEEKKLHGEKTRCEWWGEDEECTGERKRSSSVQWGEEEEEWGEGEEKEEYMMDI